MYIQFLRIALAVIIAISFSGATSYADIQVGFNTDGSPKFAPDPPGASGPIATPEKPAWIPNSDGTPTQAEKNYTFLPDAEKNKEAKSELTAEAPPGMIQTGFNPDGSPKFGPAPQESTGPIATPEKPNWVKNPDGTPTQAEKDYTFLADAVATELLITPELKQTIKQEISKSKFTKTKDENGYLITSSLEISGQDPTIKAIAVKKGMKNKSVFLTYNEDGQLTIEASEKLKGYKIQIMSGKNILKKILLT